MNRSRHQLWTWLSVALYGAMVLAIQALHVHDGGQCSTCGCVLSHRNSETASHLASTDSDPTEEPSSSDQSAPFSPHEDECPACRFISQPKSLTTVVSPPEIGEAFEIAEYSLLVQLQLAPEWATPPVRGPPAL